MSSSKTLFIAIPLVLLAVFFGIAGWLRFTDLSGKPMHADESEQSYTLGKLLQGDGYRYNPKEHHGPTLYYITATVNTLAGKRSLADLSERNVRGVTAVFGMLLVAVPLLWWRRRSVTPAINKQERLLTPDSFPTGGVSVNLKRTAGIASISPYAILMAVALGATSPVAVYYARYFVQESIFAACFWAAIPLLWQALSAPDSSSLLRRGICAVLAGVAFALAVASKETWVLMAAAAGAGGIAVVLLNWKTFVVRWTSLQANPRAGLSTLGLFLVFAFVAAFVAAAFFSSFGKNPGGIWDSVTTYFSYKDKAFDDPHVKAFGWYSNALFTSLKIGKMSFVFEEALLFNFARAILIGINSLWRGEERGVATVARVSGGSLFLLYSLISYKTPWLMLGVLPPLWLAAGLGFVAVLRYLLQYAERAKNRLRLRLAQVAVVALCAMSVLLVWSRGQSAKFLSGRFSADERNRLAYVHTTSDTKNVEVQAARIARFVAPDVLFARVHSGEYAQLLWYLRAYEGRVWFSRTVPPGDLDAPVIITDGNTEALVAPRLKAKYVEEPIVLRPGVLLRLRLREDLLNKAMDEENAALKDK